MQHSSALQEGDGGNPVKPGTINLNTTFPIGKYSKILDIIPKNVRDRRYATP